MQRMATEIVYLNNFIRGEFVGSKNGNYIDSFNPAKGEVWAKVPDSDEYDVNEAVEAAKEAFPTWSSLSTKERSAYMMKIADSLENRLNDFALAESTDQGKTVTQAFNIEIPRAVYNFRHFATSILHQVHESKVQEDLGVVNYVVTQPVGVAGLISPWNLPLYLLTFKIAPAIAAGNTVVCKPSEITSVTAWKLCQLLKDIDFPAGVVNMVFGNGPRAGEALVKHPDVSIISFTGSTIVGKKIYNLASENYKKLSLELGGKNAGIIFEDADLDQCIPVTIRSSFSNQGEICLCTSRLFVQRGIFDKFLEKFVAATKKIKVGCPLDKDVFMGPLVSKEHLAKVRGYIEIAKKDGAKFWTQDSDFDFNLSSDYKNGYFMAPVIISNLSDSSACMTEEIFGPVVCVVPFDTEAEVIKRANAVKYGLCAAVWSADAGKLIRVAHQLQVGTVWSNCWMIRCLDMPFGGSKQSGLGREGTQDSMEVYTEKKTVCIKF
ncbi:Aldehyde dehydrogenase 8 member A1 [Chamberlinius hualienensis]